MNPYERPMNLAAGMNAMMTKACTIRQVRTHNQKRYDFYYNPMWSLLGDNNQGPAGTIYDTSNQGTYGWNMFDQVVLHHKAIPFFLDVKIISNSGNFTLVDSNGRPDRKNSSDHLPILVSFKGA